MPLLDVFNKSKERILSLVLDPMALDPRGQLSRVLDPHAQPQSIAVKTVGWKFVQKVLLVGTRAVGVDPRVSALVRVLLLTGS